jgi:hypothetical protein
MKQPVLQAPLTHTLPAAQPEPSTTLVQFNVEVDT